VITAARYADRWVTDANAAFVPFARDQGCADPTARADAYVLADLKSCVALHGPSLKPLTELQGWLDERWDAIANAELNGPRGEVIAHRLSKVGLRAPIQVPVLRNFAAFEDHLRRSYLARWGSKSRLNGMIGLLPSKAIQPQCSVVTRQSAGPAIQKSSIGGAGARNRSRPGRQLHSRLHDPQRLLCGGCLGREMEMSTGPFKRKDFAWGLGPWIVTPDEFGKVATTKMRVSVNGEVWAESRPGAMQWSFPEMISCTSKDETLKVGDVFDSGTVNNGCGFETNRWLSEGDIVRIEASKIGVLRNCITAAREKEVVWRQKQRYTSQ
jgi:hypothetical protein